MVVFTVILVLFHLLHVELNDGRIVNRHLDQLREDSAASNATAPSSVTNNDDVPS